MLAVFVLSFIISSMDDATDQPNEQTQTVIAEPPADPLSELTSASLPAEPAPNPVPADPTILEPVQPDLAPPPEPIEPDPQQTLPEPVPAPTPPSARLEPAPEPPADTVPTAAPITPEPQKSSPAQAPPGSSTEESIPNTQDTVPSAVLNLSDEELKIAAALYLKKNQIAISQKGVKARQNTMHKNMEAIRSYIRQHGPSPLPRIAKHCNITPGTTSSYLRRLLAQGRIQAAGHGTTRRYFM